MKETFREFKMVKLGFLHGCLNVCHFISFATAHPTYGGIHKFKIFSLYHQKSLFILHFVIFSEFRGQVLKLERCPACLAMRSHVPRPSEMQ